jgi:glucosamine-6-phosphate deaminase
MDKSSRNTYSYSYNRVKKHPKELLYQLKSFERIPVEIFKDAEDGSRYIAHSISLAIKAKQQRGQNIVLGLATGSSPLKIYAELIRMHQEEGLSFYNVITFNLDEYYPIPPNDPESYNYFMNEYLFKHIDIPAENINIPNGELKLEDIHSYCELYEKKIALNGGIDIQILGIGRTGHVGFNEPGSEKDSTTRLVRLDSITRRDAQKDFGTLDNVPYRAITMGMKTILSAKEIFIMAWGQHKAEISRKAIEFNPTVSIPSTFLQEHPQVRFCMDLAASEELTRVKMPWRVGTCEWTDDLVCKAVIWLSQKLEKPILKLTDDDYSELGLHELILERKNAYSINIFVFNKLQHTITGWPGGKPNTDDSNRPERAKPGKKKVIIFSPHPDDDVISMGGTFLRLVDQNHDVYVAYQTSGNIAVHDHDALRFLEFYEELGNAFDFKADQNVLKMAKKALTGSLQNRNTPEVRIIKGLIRRGEAKAGARFIGLDDSHIHFLDLPFYETGLVKKKSISEEDISIMVDILEKYKPHQVFAAGDLADPHGTHRVCLDAILAAFDRIKGKAWVKNCWLWLYRGAWHEFSIDEIEMSVPLSPEELVKKRKAIYMHQSQKDRPPFPGEDNREFWQRAEERNRNTANTYRKLGFAEYEAMEAFKRWKF